MEWSAGKTWYKTEGQGEPLVVIHGGPGYPHFYLEGLLALASSERQVIVYDQLGCGFSKANEGFEQWSVSLFVEEFVRTFCRSSRISKLVSKDFMSMVAVAIFSRFSGEVMYSKKSDSDYLIR